MVNNIINGINVASLEGFSVEELVKNISSVPVEQGVYFVVRETNSLPEFCNSGTGGHFKGRNPNVDIEELERNWVANTNILYIGKAGGGSSSSTLQKRIKQYIQFGCGAPVGHWGGRYIWQLKDCMQLQIKWLPITDGDAAKVESELIQAFKELHGGNRPFANLKD